MHKGRRLSLPALWLLPLLGCTGCSHLAQGSWTGRDKAQHFVGSALLAVAGSAIAEHQSASPARSRNIGFGLAISFGALKEAWDSRHRLELEGLYLGRRRRRRRLQPVCPERLAPHRAVPHGGR